MKKTILAGFLLAVFAILMQAGPSSAVAVSDYPAGNMAGGISKSRHNLGAFGRVITTLDTSEICVFCHTPHHSNTVSGLRPLWNRGVAGSFTAYGKTIGGTTISDGDIGGATLACLSCHDGITTFDNLVNAPGKGGVVAGGTDLGWTFYMPGGVGSTTWGVPDPLDHFGDAKCTVCHSDEDYYNNNTRLKLGTDLTDDHPVSVPYLEGQVASLRLKSQTISAIDLTTDLQYSSTGGFDDIWNNNLSQNRWAVNGFISEIATIQDLLRNDKVECSSCHDPHFRNLSWDEVEDTWADGFKTDWCGNIGENCSDGLFLRRVGGNSGSAICRTCHAK